MPPIRITASDSSKHTPKSIAKHQLYKSTGILTKRDSNKPSSAKNSNNNVKDDYVITGYNDLVLYPEFQVSFEDNSEDEFIDDNEDEQGLSDSAVVKGMKFLMARRFDPHVPNAMKGVMTKALRSKIIEKQHIYPPILVKNQLYSIFVNQVTKVDKEIEKCIIQGTVIKLLINHISFNDNLIIFTKDYLKILDDKIAIEDEQDLENFRRLIVDNLGTSMFNVQDLHEFGIQSVSNLIQYGFLNYSLESKSDLYISLPNLGNYLRLLTQSTLFIKTVIHRSKSKKLLESNLIEKWEFNNNNWFKFYGLNLKFILSLNYGLGSLENFNTNVGTGWKLS